jgi:hypothetical protein
MEKMTYNTQKENVKLLEYGRSIQAYVSYVKTIEDPERRQQVVEGILHMMRQVAPPGPNVNQEEYRLKLWSHLLFMAGGELDVVIPEGVIDFSEGLNPEEVAYPTTKGLVNRRYGRNIQRLMAKAQQEEDEEKRADFIEGIGAFMKMASAEWFGEQLSDQDVRKDINELSKGTLQLDEDAEINSLLDTTRRGKQYQNIHTTQIVKRNKKKKFVSSPTGNSSYKPSGERPPLGGREGFVNRKKKKR